MERVDFCASGFGLFVRGLGRSFADHAKQFSAQTFDLGELCSTRSKSAVWVLIPSSIRNEPLRRASRKRALHELAQLVRSVEETSRPAVVIFGGDGTFNRAADIASNRRKLLWNSRGHVTHRVPTLARSSVCSGSVLP